MKKTLFAVAAASVLLVGCGGASSVTDDREETCATLASFESWMRPAMAVTNPDGTMGEAQEALRQAGVQIEQVRPELSSGQQDLLDRTYRALAEYSFVSAGKDPNSTLAANSAGLESFQYNVLVNHRVMLNTVGCPLPDFLASLPTG